MEIPEGPHRRRRQNVWQKMPKAMKMAIGVCLVLVAVSIATGNRVIEWSQNRFAAKPEPPKKPKINPGKAFDQVAAAIQPFDMELSGTKLNPVTRRIEGTITNKSDRAYTDIEMIFALPSRDLSAQDQTIVIVDRLGPRGRAKFISDVLPKDVHQWALIRTSAKPAR